MAASDVRLVLGCALAALAGSGCLGPTLSAGEGPEDPWKAFETCGGQRKGNPVPCQRDYVEIDPGPIPSQGWAPVNSYDGRFDDWTFYRSTNLGPQRVGFHFSLTPRTQGDFESPHPPVYGGFLSVNKGPLVAWHSTKNSGFVEYPAEVPFLKPAEAALFVYVPITNSDDPEIRNSSFKPIWSQKEVRSAEIGTGGVLEVSTARRTLYLHDGLDGVGSFGTATIVPERAVFHRYIIFQTDREYVPPWPSTPLVGVTG